MVWSFQPGKSLNSVLNITADPWPKYNSYAFKLFESQKCSTKQKIGSKKNCGPKNILAPKLVLKSDTAAIYA